MATGVDGGQSWRGPCPARQRREMGGQVSKAEQAVEPASGDWLDAPQGSCDHDHVVILSDPAGDPAGVGGRTMLWCAECDMSWWEDLSNVRKS